MRLEHICQHVSTTKDSKYYCKARSIAALDCKYLGNLFTYDKTPYRFCEKPGDPVIDIYNFFKNLFLQFYNCVVK